jgi:hypothetical protein
MLDHAVPQVDSDAWSYAAFQEIRLLQSLGCKVTFLPRNLAWMDRHTRALEKIGVECLYAPFVMNVEDYLRANAADFDLFLITGFRIAREVTSVIRRNAPSAKIILNVADLHFMREFREAAAGSPDHSFEDAQDIRKTELRTIESADLTLAFSDAEASVIQSHLMNGAKVCKAPWVVDVNEAPTPAFAETKDILFLRDFVDDPNGSAVKFFARSVMPRLREKLPDVKFKVVGGHRQDDAPDLESDGVDMLGSVRDLGGSLASTRVHVAPLLVGGGIAGRVIEGMAQAVPSVLSAAAVEGTGLSGGTDCLVARTVDEWVEQVVRLYTDEELWTSVRDTAQRSLRDRFSFAVGQEMMRDALAMVEVFPPTEGLHYKRTRP